MFDEIDEILTDNTKPGRLYSTILRTLSCTEKKGGPDAPSFAAIHPRLLATVRTESSSESADSLEDERVSFACDNFFCSFKRSGKQSLTGISGSS